jgi:hypothetical protein
MKPTLCAIFFLLMATVVDAQTTAMPPSFDIIAAERFANLALPVSTKNTQITSAMR